MRDFYLQSQRVSGLPDNYFYQKPANLTDKRKRRVFINSSFGAAVINRYSYIKAFRAFVQSLYTCQKTVKTTFKPLVLFDEVLSFWYNKTILESTQDYLTLFNNP